MASHLFLPPTITVKLTNAPQFTRFSTPKPRKHLHFHHARASSNPDGGGGGGGGGGADSYLGMWKKAVERERKASEFLKIAQNSPPTDGKNDGGVVESPEVLEMKSTQFQKILEVSKEERDRIQRIQVIDRAAAAIAAARSLLKDKKSTTRAAPKKAEPKPQKTQTTTSEPLSGTPRVVSEIILSPVPQIGGTDTGNVENSQSRASGNGPPGPDFWSWTPPPEDDSSRFNDSNVQKAPKTSGSLLPTNDVIEKERSADYLAIPFESKLPQAKNVQSLPPFQSFMEVHEVESTETTEEPVAPKEDIGFQFSAHAAEAADALLSVDEKPSHGIKPNGSRWWKETGVETRPDGVVCRWTLNRGVTADGVVEWEEKYWEASDEFGYKELGSEKSGRDAMGNVWHECWKESMWQEQGLTYMEKTADKWGKNGKGDEWQENWWEHYDTSGKADKWAHKWCSIDPNTQIEAGHAHVWHERWGEKYDGQGGSVKYTDKWAERCEGDAWVKWGDKWDENFDPSGHGVKQGETWWQGKYGDQWNRTWGEHHNGSGWVHKYGKSSSGEHWDTHAQEDTWYERYPHFGFLHCFQNSVQLREVKKPSETA